MGTNYMLLSSTTVGSGGASSIDFSAIPQTYHNLAIRLSARTTTSTGAANLRITLNGTTGTAYSSQSYNSEGNTATPVATLETAQASGFIGKVPTAGLTASMFSIQEITIPQYAQTTYAKTLFSTSVNETNAAATDNFLGLYAVNFTGTAAISSISIFCTSLSFAQYTTAALYGISNS